VTQTRSAISRSPNTVGTFSLAHVSTKHSVSSCFSTCRSIIRRWMVFKLLNAVSKLCFAAPWRFIRLSMSSSDTVSGRISALKLPEKLEIHAKSGPSNSSSSCSLAARGMAVSSSLLIRCASSSILLDEPSFGAASSVAVGEAGRFDLGAARTPECSSTDACLAAFPSSEPEGRASVASLTGVVVFSMSMIDALSRAFA
jgi:hypothetical protein